MQVDTGQLRRAAAQIRESVIPRLTKAADWSFPDASFDQYATRAPYDEVLQAWLGEITIIKKAALELAEELERTAADYDSADAGAARRLTAPR
jgi:hypothetical protein